MIEWTAFFASFLVLVGLVLTTAAALKALEIDRFILAHENSQDKIDLKVIQVFRDRFPETLLQNLTENNSFDVLWHRIDRTRLLHAACVIVDRTLFGLI